MCYSIIEIVMEMRRYVVIFFGGYFLIVMLTDGKWITSYSNYYEYNKEKGQYSFNIVVNGNRYRDSLV